MGTFGGEEVFGGTAVLCFGIGSLDSACVDLTSIGACPRLQVWRPPCAREAQAAAPGAGAIRGARREVLPGRVRGQQLPVLVGEHVLRAQLLALLARLPGGKPWP